VHNSGGIHNLSSGYIKMISVFLNTLQVLYWLIHSSDFLRGETSATSGTVTLSQCFVTGRITSSFVGGSGFYEFPVDLSTIWRSFVIIR
jgi:hypothetical protein